MLFVLYVWIIYFSKAIDICIILEKYFEGKYNKEILLSFLSSFDSGNDSNYI